MSRYRGPVSRLCRREGMKLFLKGAKCYIKKCPFERRPTPPGQHAVRRRKMSEFGVQLREKQKMRRIYSVHERQFKRYFETAEQRPGVTGENLLRLLETRLDNVVYPDGLRHQPCPGATARRARPFHGQRPWPTTSRRSRLARATRSRFARRAASRIISRTRARRCAAPAKPDWLNVDIDQPDGQRHRRCRGVTRCQSSSTSSWSSSTTRGN